MQEKFKVLAIDTRHVPTIMTTMKIRKYFLQLDMNSSNIKKIDPVKKPHCV
jgi:hypothetical protein